MDGSRLAETGTLAIRRCRLDHASMMDALCLEPTKAHTARRVLEVKSHQPSASAVEFVTARNEHIYQLAL